MNWTAIVATILITFLITAFLIFAFTTQTERQSIGSNIGLKTVNVTVWKDKNQTARVTEIEWGVMEPGENKTFSCYVRSEANVPAQLWMSTANWKPEEAQNHISLAWNLDGETLQPQETRQTNITMMVDGSIQNITGFSHDIIVEATG